MSKGHHHNWMVRLIRWVIWMTLAFEAVGAALLAHKKGDEIETTGPTGRVIKMKIVNIEH